MRNAFYVYAWLRPCGTPFYIGKGTGDRDTRPKRNRFFDNVVAKIRDSGGTPTVVRVVDNVFESEAFEREKMLIRTYGRRNTGTGILVNLTDGGEGPSGWIPSEETKLKISAAKAGRSLSLEHRAKISASCANPSEEIRDKISKSLLGNKRALGLKHSDETRERMRDAHKGNKNALGHKHTDKARGKMSAAHKGVKRAPHSIEAKEKMRAAKLGKRQDKEHRANNAATKRMMPPRSGFKGVSFDKCRSKWSAKIKIDGVGKNLGRFTEASDAARAYDLAAFDAWGRECYLNFPDEIGTKEAA